MRDSLMASEGIVPEIRPTVSISRYTQLAFTMFKTAQAASLEGYISRAYVSWKLFLLFMFSLKQHPKYKSPDKITKFFKKWSEDAWSYAFDLLEDIVVQMDREEGGSAHLILCHSG